MVNRVGAAVAFAAGLIVSPAFADEGGISFWLPGEYSSLAAVPPTPGLSYTAIYYHTSTSAGANQPLRRGGAIVGGLDASADLGLFGGAYTFDGDVFGARPALSLLGAYGQTQGAVGALLTGPRGNTIPVSIDQTATGFTDLFPQFALYWNKGVDNYMTYLTGDVPVGAYNPRRLVSTGLGHGAIDSGVAYTYLNPQTGHEFSVTTGFTYNFVNPDNQYQSGIDWHLDWGASEFIAKNLLVGMAGYVYQQVTGDSGPTAVLGPFQSRVIGVGPQAGYLFPVGGMQGYLNAKVFAEFASENRPEGWNVWLVFNVAPPAQQ